MLMDGGVVRGREEVMERVQGDTDMAEGERAEGGVLHETDAEVGGVLMSGL